MKESHLIYKTLVENALSMSTFTSNLRLEHNRRPHRNFWFPGYTAWEPLTYTDPLYSKPHATRF